MSLDTCSRFRGQMNFRALMAPPCKSSLTFLQQYLSGVLWVVIIHTHYIKLPEQGVCDGHTLWYWYYYPIKPCWPECCLSMSDIMLDTSPGIYMVASSRALTLVPKSLNVIIKNGRHPRRVLHGDPEGLAKRLAESLLHAGNTHSDICERIYCSFTANTA